MLIGGDKTGDDRWYVTHIPIADRLYDEHLEQLRQEGLSDAGRARIKELKSRKLRHD